MAETWSIKTSPSLPSSAIQWSSGFVSDGIYFTKITIGTDKITYTNSLGDTDVYTSSTWVKDNYRTIAFINSPSGTLLTWLNANATKLVTSTKTISYDNLTVFKALMDNKYDIELDGKLDKIKGPFSGYDRLYAVSSNGVQYGVGYTSAIGKGTIVARNSAGEILVPTPTSDDGAVPKTYVDTELDKKLDKMSHTDGLYHVYLEYDGTQTSAIASFGYPQARRIAMWDDNARLQTADPDPAKDKDCVNVAFLNKQLNNKLDKVTGSTTYRQAYVKDTNGSQVMINISADKVGNSIVQRNADNGVACNTQLFTEPDWYDNTTITTMPMVNMTSSDKLIMLPLDNIIVEKSVDGGETWTAFDAGSEAQTNKQKRSLFTGSNNYGIGMPKIDGKNSPLCMLRVTITGMTYNVPEGTAETERYNYWNKDYIKASYRYCSINNLWFWITAADNRIQVKVEGATGTAPDNWTEFGNATNASGWSGAAQVRINPERTFGGGTVQTSNYWNWRITFRAVGRNGETDGTNFNASTYSMDIISIKGFGKSIWTYGYNNLAGLNSVFKIRDNDYNFEMQQGSYYPALGSTYDLGNADQRWRFVYAQYFSEGGVLLSNKYAAIADLDNKLDKVTSAIQDSVYGVKVSKSVDPFQTESIIAPTSGLNPDTVGTFVLKYKTIVGLISNGWLTPCTYEVTANSISSTPVATTAQPQVAFRFDCASGLKFNFSYTGTNISYVSIIYFSSDGTLLNSTPIGVTTSKSFTVPSSYSKDPVYGMVCFQGSPAGSTVTLTSLNITLASGTAYQTMYPLSATATKDTVVLRDGNGEIKTVTPTQDDSVANKVYVDSTIGDKVDKVLTATDYIQVYAKLQNGTQTMRDVSTEFVPNGIVMRDENNQVWTPNPTYEFAATPKTYVDTALDGKLDKITNVSTYDQAYVKASNGTNMMFAVSTKPVIGAISRYSTAGVLQTNDPVDDLDAINKQSMDAAIQGVIVMITDLRSGS